MKDKTEINQIAFNCDIVIFCLTSTYHKNFLIQLIPYFHLYKKNSPIVDSLKARDLCVNLSMSICIFSEYPQVYF